MANPAETAYLSFQDGKLSNAVRLVEFRPRKVAVHTFLWVVPSRAAQTAFVPELSKAITFFVSGPILVKFHIRTRLIEGFPTIFRTWLYGEEKLHFTPVHTLRQLKHDEALIPPLRRVVDFRARYGYETARRFWGGPNLKSVGLTVEEK